VLRSLDKWRDFKFPPFSHLPAIRPRCRARMWHVARARRRVEPRNTTHTNDPRVHSRCGSHKRARTRSEQTRLRPRAGNAAFNAADGAFDGGQKRRRKRVRLGGWWRRWARPGDNGELRYLESISGSRRGQTRAPRYLPPPPLPPCPAAAVCRPPAIRIETTACHLRAERTSPGGWNRPSFPINFYIRQLHPQATGDPERLIMRPFGVPEFPHISMRRCR